MSIVCSVEKLVATNPDTWTVKRGEKPRSGNLSAATERDFTRLHGQRLANFRPIVNSPKNSLRSLLHSDRSILNISSSSRKTLFNNNGTSIATD